MKYVFATLGVAAMVAGLWARSVRAQAKAAPAADGTHRGTFVSATGGKLVMTDQANKEHSHAIAKDAKFTLDGKAVAIEAFKKGMSVTVSTDKEGHATAVACTTAKPAGATKRAPAPATPPAKATPPAAPAKSSAK